ncbi:MAG: PqqD family protein [Lachnospiraceae bacterium]|nr:PqqD family protein [Lachnospiraceae bacterium]
MKIKDGFLLRSVAGRTVVIPADETLNLNIMITLNETGCFLWKRLEKGASMQELIDALMEEYNVEETLAEADVKRFLEKLREEELLEVEA